ncbi:MAG TPA: hypothetical protein VH371_11435 [Candidatus Limnocylindrales bacterium]|jgi:hypothetical protein
MADETAQARQRVADARRNASSELDTLGSSTRAALDFPAKIKRHPLETVGLLGGLAFLVLGGPRRTAKATERRFFPERANRPPTLLPKEVDKTLKALPEEDRERVRAHLERDFAAYLKKEHVGDASTGRQSFWKTYDMLVGIVGTAAARELVKRALAVPADARVEQAQEDAKAAEEIQASGGVQNASPERAAKR